MANDVFANGREISCKSADGKSICAFPDVCFTPPQSPATPPGVPVPYPNSGFARDTTSGSRSVKISGKEVMLKNKSYFKKSLGDEAGCAPKKGILTSVNRGKVYFTSWSMDVKYEGENVVRHLDLTTHNHGSGPNTATWPYVDAMRVGTNDPCKKDKDNEKSACAEYSPYGRKNACAHAGLTKKPSQTFDAHVLTKAGFSKRLDSILSYRRARQNKDVVGESLEALDAYTKAEASDCIRARRCRLEPYSRKRTGCCPGQTPHHLIEASAFFKSGRGKSPKSVPVRGTKWLTWKRFKPRPPDNYNEDDAPCVCAEGTSNTVGSHGLMHTIQSRQAMAAQEKLYTWPDETEERLRIVSYKQARDNSINAMQKVFARSGCTEPCLRYQLDAYHNRCGISDSTYIKAVVCGKTSDEDQLHCSRIIDLYKVGGRG